MSVQNSVSNDPAKAVAGMEADNGPKDVISKVANETVLYGNFVTRVAGDEGKCKRPAEETDITAVASQLGIARAAFDVESKADGLDPNYSQYDLVSVAQSGRYYVKVEEAVTTADPVFVRYANKPEIVTIVYSKDFENGDSADITINGALVQTAFDTNNAATYAAIDAALTAAFAGTLQDVTVAAGTNTITLTSALGVDLTVSAADTASLGTATVATTQVGTSELTKGNFRKDADTATAAQWSQARYVEGAAANDFAVIDIAQ